MKDSNELQVIVAGNCNTGKTTLGLMLTDFLREKGVTVMFNSEPDFPSEGVLREKYNVGKNVREVDVLNKLKNVTVSEVMTIKSIGNVAKLSLGGIHMGVGNGDGNKFVTGDYDSIKTLQAKMIELESLRMFKEGVEDMVNKSGE